MSVLRFEYFLLGILFTLKNNEQQVRAPANVCLFNQTFNSFTLNNYSNGYLWWRDRLHFGGGLDGGEETGYLADLSRARVTQGLILSRGRGNSRDKMLIMRACSQTSVISFAVDGWSRHATGGENALRDEIKQLKTTIAKIKK